MKATFHENENARDLVTIREDDPIWYGQTAIDPIPKGALVRAFIPADATHVDQALELIGKHAAAIATHYMPRGEAVFDKPHVASQSIREVIKSMVNDADLFPLIEETMSKVGL